MQLVRLLALAGAVLVLLCSPSLGAPAQTSIGSARVVEAPMIRTVDDDDGGGKTSIWEPLGVLAAFLVAAIALFAQPLREWYRQPRLSLRVPSKNEVRAIWESPHQAIATIWLEVHSARGKRTARDVEVRLEIKSLKRIPPEEDAGVPPMEILREPRTLIWKTRREVERDGGTTQLDIPPDDRRPISVAYMGPVGHVWSRIGGHKLQGKAAGGLEQPWGVYAAFPLRPEEFFEANELVIKKVDHGISTYIISVSASDVNVRRFRVKLEVEINHGPGRSVKARWLGQPEEISTPPIKWLRRLSP